MKTLLTTILTTLFMLAISFAGYAQQEVVQDFESSPPIAGFEGLTSATIISDTSTAGNGMILELVTSAAGNPWQGAEVILADSSSLNLTSDITVSVDVWSNVAFSPMLKVETTGSATGSAPFSANTQSHTGSGWETLTFTFNTGHDGTSTANGIYNKAVIFPNRSEDGSAWNTPSDGTFYFDNITGVKGIIGATPANPPTTAAPTPPTRDAADVISLFSNAYTNITVSTWSAPWDDSTIEDVVIDGNDTKKITFNNFLGVDFVPNAFDATEMTHFHMDYWTGETELDGKVANVKWSNHQNGADETNALELTNPIPANATGQWVSVDVPLTDFNPINGADRSAFAQFLITSNLNVLYVDNIYLYKGDTNGGGGGETGSAPTVAAPTPPARDAADVISIFSDAYTNINVDTFSADFDDSTIEDVMIAGNATKLIDFTNFIGIDFQSNRQDASTMTHFHMDFWTSETDLIGKVFNSKFSQWGGGAGEVSAFELPINTGTNPAIVTGSWVSIDVPISSFTNAPQTRDDIAQFLITSNLDSVYVDNIYFYNDGTGTGGGGGQEPGVELLTNGDFENGRAPWTDTAGEIRTEGDNSFFFADVASAGDPFAVNLSQVVEIVQGETYTFTFDASTSEGNTRTMIAGIGLNEAPFSSVTQVISLTDQVQTFTLELVAANFGIPNSRVLFDMGAETGIVVIDNVSLVVSEGGPGETPEPTTAAPDQPARAAADVISLFSSEYADVTVDTWRTPWSNATLTDVTIEGNATKKYSALDVVGIETVANQLDITDMTNFHLNVWSPDFTQLGIKLVDFGPDGAFDGGDDTEHQVDLPGLAQAEWVTLDIDISDFTGLTTFGNIAQLILVGQPTAATTVFVDNVYFYRPESTSNEEVIGAPKGFVLEQNYPNPFNPTTNISFSIPQSGDVKLEVFNMMGQKLMTLVDGVKSAGSYSVTFDATNFASGIYLYRLTAGNEVRVNRMTLLK